MEDFLSDDFNKAFIQKYFIEQQLKEWNEISSNWNYSSVKLKNWLNKYFPTEFGKYDNSMDININYILPYRHNRFWGNDDLWRLKYALKCKLVILSQYGLDEIRTQYAVEALRLWLRFNTKATKLTCTGFLRIIDECYIETKKDWYGTVEECQAICKKYKPKRKQTLYHYKEQDFIDIQSWMKLDEAYHYWLEYVYPHLLDNFKIQKRKELYINFNKDKAVIEQLPFEMLDKLNAELDLVKVNKLGKQQFAKYLKKYKIKYQKL